jgi:hypothetical protein
MGDQQDDLRATEESVRRDAERVKTLEEEKAALDPLDPRVDDLSEQVVRVTAGIHDKAIAERELSEEIRPTD